MTTAYGTILYFSLCGGVLAALLLSLNRYLAPCLRIEPALVPFESGQAPDVHAWHQYHARFFGFALVFILFDMEMVFMYPWAVVFLEEGVKALAEMGIFIAILVIGILYAWREKAFEWD
ncbi:NADH-quinone oxidoreductase subunit A [Aurantimonas marina]|uniref:NADH-quinone oxidoreductase subunit A n=1 Tax=Aurantimonas marina TaxID=2780508 RepID=UPI002FCD8C80